MEHQKRTARYSSAKSTVVDHMEYLGNFKYGIHWAPLDTLVGTISAAIFSKDPYAQTLLVAKTHGKILMTWEVCAS